MVPRVGGKRGECTLQNRREESRTARFDSVRRSLRLWNSAYRTRISGFAGCRDDDWSDAMPSKIEDYAMLGDCETSALVARNGSVDWLCWPRFDSNACFAALLGDPKNGRWLIAPEKPNRETARRYRENTLILETEIETEDGAATLIEFMPPRRTTSDLVRIVVGKRGAVAMRTELIIRFDYGSLVPWVTTREDGTLCAIAGPDMVCPANAGSTARRGSENRRRIHCFRGRGSPVRSHLRPIASGDSCRQSIPSQLLPIQKLFGPNGRASFTAPVNGRRR